MQFDWFVQIVQDYPLTTPLIHLNGLPQLDHLVERTSNIIPDVQQFADYFLTF